MMLSPDEATQTTDSLRQVPRTSDRRSMVSERRQSILQQKQSERQTDTLPQLNAAPPEGRRLRDPWQQAAQLRGENRRLQREVETLQSELKQLASSFEEEMVVVHSGQLLELEHFQGHLQEVINERNQLRESHLQLERRYQELYSNFQASVQEEAGKMVAEAAQTLVLSPENTPGILHDVKKTIELYARQVEDKQLVEVLYLKREVQRMNALLQQEHQQLEVERQKLLQMQHTAREQAALRHKIVQSRLRTRWTIALVFVALGLMTLLIVLQCLFLLLFRTNITPQLAISIFAPVVLCVVVAIVFSHPISMIRHTYSSAPHKKKVK